MPQDIDPKVKKLVSAIAQTETGQASPDAYRKRGASGEYGRYQFMPDTWRRYASEAGINKPLEESTIEDQNKVAYNKIKSLKDKGYTPAQIASMWNAGEGEPDAYKGTFSTGRPSKGVNSKGVAFDVPAYAQKVSAAYMGAGGIYNPPPAPQPFQAPATTGFENLQGDLGMKKEGFVGQLGQDLSNVGTGITKAVQDTQSGAINPASGVLQGAGAIAGGVGQIVDTGLSNLPLGLGKAYQYGSEKIGQAVGGAAEATGATAAFNKLSPETQGNIGAAGNIASVVPFFKAFGTGKRGFADAMTKLREPSIKKEAAGEISDQLTVVPKRQLDNAESRGLDPMGTVLNNKDFLPDEKDVNGKTKWDTTRATENLQKSIDADEDALQNLFEAQLRTKPGINEMAFNINAVRRQTMDDVLNEKGLTGGYNAIEKLLNDYFDGYTKSLQRESGREFVNLSELNNIKRDLRQTINYNALDPFAAVAKETRGAASQSIMRQVEEAAKKLGIKGVPELNKQMGTKITARDVLESINDKTVKSKKAGLIRRGARLVPLAGRLVKEKPSTATQRLARKRRLRETARKGLVQLGVGQALANQQGQGKQ